MADGTADKIGQRLKHITAEMKRYIEKRLELIVLNIGEQYARYIAQSIQKLAGFVLLFGALTFLLIALALYLGDLLNSRALGFVLVSLPLMIGGYLFINLKPRSITNKIRSEFETELLSVFEDLDEPDKNKLLTQESKELPKEKHRHE